MKQCLTIAVLLLLSACVYRIDIQQGNLLDAEKIAEIKTGMTQDEVKTVLGTPMVQDTLHPNRWDYVWHERDGKTLDTETHRFSVFFENDQVSRVEQSGFIKQETS